MNSINLTGLKIAVIIESQYISSELKTYREVFNKYGAEVHFVSRLWDKNEQIFIREIERGNQIIGESEYLGDTLVKDIETAKANYDVEKIHLDDYAAVVMSANFTSVRCRHYKDGEEDKRSTPVVRFFSKAMRNKRIVKGLLCHGLWILTPCPEFLAGRKVTCHEVLRADVENAGGIFTKGEEGIVVDDDLVTGDSGKRAPSFAETIAQEIMLRQTRIQCDSDQIRPSLIPREISLRKRRVLTLVSEFGYWGEELVGPMEVFQEAGYEVDFVTPTGKRPVAISVSMDSETLDPPLGRSVTTEEMARKTRRWDDPATKEGKRLDNPKNLSIWFPERPYASAPQHIRMLEKYHREKDIATESLAEYDALLIVGGSGPIVDLANNQRVHDLIFGFLRADKIIGAECYGVACLAFARDWQDGTSILWGKRVTGHCKEYDYHDGTGFMKHRGEFYDFNMGPPPYPLEFILRDATGPNGAFIGNFGKETSVVVDYPFVTGRSTPDSYLTGQKIVECLDGNPPLRRWGW